MAADLATAADFAEVMVAIQLRKHVDDTLASVHSFLENGGSVWDRLRESSGPLHRHAVTAPMKLKEATLSLSDSTPCTRGQFGFCAAADLKKLWRFLQHGVLAHPDASNAPA